MRTTVSTVSALMADYIMALGQHQKVMEGLANEEDQLKLDLQVLGAEIELLRQRQAALFLRRVDNSSAAKVRPSVSLIATGIITSAADNP